MLSPEPSVTSANTINVQSELEQLIDLIIDNPHIPLSGRVLVNEEVLIEQIERIQDGLPEAFYQAEDVVRRQQEIVSNAELQAKTIIDQAHRQAAQIANELGIRERAEQEALAIRQQVAQECESMRSQTLADIERLKRQLRQELDTMRREAQMECEEIQQGADQYADRVLRSLESTLADSSQKIASLTKVVHNGREQLQMNDPSP
jgi:F0F1-type ATP synthase membrane subunit b/b'